MSELCVGTKIVEAKPQAKNGFQEYKVTYKEGYVSWSPVSWGPKEAFDEAYKKLSDMLPDTK